MAIRNILRLLARHKTRALILLLYLLAVAFSVSCLTLKRDSLQFHPIDYSYFVEQAARLSNPLLDDRFALNIDGYNFLGLQGTEDAYSIFQAIHIEYFRYTYTILYWLFHSSLALYIFYCLLFFLPILYFALLPRPNTRAAWLPPVLFALLYLSIPAALNSVTYDLRPRILFIAAWSLVVLAVYYRRPFREKLILFLFLLFLREESILLGGIVLVLNFIRMPATSDRWKQTFLFLFLTLANFAAFLAFMKWGGYNEFGPFNPNNFLTDLSLSGLLALSTVGILLLLLVVLVARRRPAYLPPLLFFLAYSAAILMTGLSAYRDITLWYLTQIAISPVTAWDVFLKIITGAQNSLALYILILAPILLLDSARGRWRSLLAGSLGALCILFAALSVYTLVPEISAWKQSLAPARLVWNFKAEQDPYQTNLLLDYNTYQAFYDFDKIIVYNRLPLWMVEPYQRYYPNNKRVLASLIRDRMQYAVISQESLANVRELAAIAGRPARVIASNQRYVVLQFR
jgi:hypothetical protein